MSEEISCLFIHFYSLDLELFSLFEICSWKNNSVFVRNFGMVVLCYATMYILIRYYLSRIVYALAHVYFSVYLVTNRQAMFPVCT